MKEQEGVVGTTRSCPGEEATWTGGGGILSIRTDRKSNRYRPTQQSGAKELEKKARVASGRRGCLLDEKKKKKFLVEPTLLNLSPPRRKTLAKGRKAEPPQLRRGYAKGEWEKKKTALFDESQRKSPLYCHVERSADRQEKCRSWGPGGAERRRQPKRGTAPSETRHLKLSLMSERETGISSYTEKRGRCGTRRRGVQGVLQVGDSLRKRTFD